MTPQRPPTPEELLVLYRDDDLLAVDKPSGLAVHRGMCADRRTVVSIVRTWPGCESASPVHRLDRGTSGVLLLALHAEALRVMGIRCLAGELEKTYVALVRGVPPDAGVIDHPVPRGEGQERVPACTEFRLLATIPAVPRTLSLVEARPLTGRFHQVRRHLKHLGHPIIGDANYGQGALNREIAGRYGLARLALHAHTLCAMHPRTNEPLVWQADLPNDLVIPLHSMGCLNMNDIICPIVDCAMVPLAKEPTAGNIPSQRRTNL